MNGRSRWNGCSKVRLRRGLPGRILACAGMTAVSAALLVSLANAAFADTFEDTMRRGFGALLDGRTAPAAQHMQSLLAEHPNSRLARLARADLFAASAHQQTLMEMPGARQKVRVRGLIEEARVRLGHRKPPRGLVPGAILQLSPLHEHALIFDAAHSRLYLLANDEGAPRPIASHYASAGNGGLGKTDEGDEKTPLGVYHLTSLLDDDKLPELYGTGAYPINYPNRWDQLHGRSGSGIWLHGTTQSTYNRPPKDRRVAGEAQAAAERAAAMAGRLAKPRRRTLPRPLLPRVSQHQARLPENGRDHPAQCEEKDLRRS